MTDEQRKMVEGALALEANLEGRTVGAADLLMPARLAGPLARLVLEVEEQNAGLRAAHAALMAPVKDADLSDARRRSEDLRGLVGGTIPDRASRHQRDLFEVAWAVTTDVFILAREVARLRSDNADLLANADAYQHMHTRAVRTEEEVERLRAERVVLTAPVDGVDLAPLLAWDDPVCHCGIELSRHHAEHHEFVANDPLEVILAREIASLRASLCGARRALDESGIASTGDLAADIGRLRTDLVDEAMRASTAYAEGLADGQALRDDDGDAESSALRAALEEARLDLKVESGAESGAPHPDWRCSNGRLRLYHRYYGGDLHAVVNADGDWMLYRAGANMLEVKEEVASGPPQLKRSAMLAADAAATQVQEKP